MARPLLRRLIGPAMAQDPLGGRVEDQEPRVASATTTPSPMQSRTDWRIRVCSRSASLGARQLVGVLFLRLWLSRRISSICRRPVKARSGVRGQGLQRAEVDAVRIERLVRGDLEGAEHLVADQRQDDLTADPRHGDRGRDRSAGRPWSRRRRSRGPRGPRRPGCRAPSSGRTVRSTTPVMRPDRADAPGSRPPRDRPARSSPGRSPVGAEPQHGVERLVDVVRVRSARSRSGRRRRAGRGRPPGRGCARRSGRSRVA